MYKLLIVEDEPIERQGMKLMIENNCSNISIIEEAENGLVALQKIQSFSPDIIMMDVSMPGLNGLETIREIRHIRKNARFIILTSHDRFEYAYEAIQLGVDDYILKPAKIARLKQTINDIIKKIEQDKKSLQDNSDLVSKMKNIRPMLEKNFLYDIITNTQKNNLEEHLSFLEFSVVSGFCIVVGSTNIIAINPIVLRNTLCDVGVQCIADLVHDKLLIFVFCENEIDTAQILERAQFVHLLLATKMQVELPVLGASRIYTDLSQLNSAYREAMVSCETAQKTSQKICLFESIDVPMHNHVQDKAQHYLDQLKYSILSQNDFLKVLKKITTKICMLESSELVKEVMYDIIILFIAYLKECGINSSTVSIPSMQDISTVASISDAVVLFKNTLQSMAELFWKQNTVYSKTLVGRALEYIDKYYTKDICLEILAQELSITPYYLSRLIKKHEGIPFPDLVAAKRIEFAKKLLLDNFSIKEAAYASGFQSQNYFTKTFKKYESITPSEYKEMYKR